MNIMLHMACQNRRRGVTCKPRRELVTAFLLYHIFFEIPIPGKGHFPVDFFQKFAILMIAEFAAKAATI